LLQRVKYTAPTINQYFPKIPVWLLTGGYFIVPVLRGPYGSPAWHFSATLPANGVCSAAPGGRSHSQWRKQGAFPGIER